MTTARALVLVLAFSVAGGCGGEAPGSLPENTETLSICEVAQSAVGDRVRVAGHFDGFGYATGSREVTLETEELCNENGAGLAFATLSGESEREALTNTEPGARVVIEGTVEEVEEGRIVRLEGAVVRSSG